jgi:glycosyltransferase involved in cell wall biosynthesis
VPEAERLRLLFVAPFPPRRDARHGGAKVLGQLLWRTAERHACGLVYLRHPSEDALEDALRDRLDVLEEISRPTGGRTTASHYLRAVRWRARLLAGTPRHVTELDVRDGVERLRDVARAWSPHIVRVEYAVMAAYLAALDGNAARRVLADYDSLLETARLPRSILERFEHRLDLAAWKRFRRSALARVDAAVVFTERDRAALLRVGGTTEVVRVPMGLEFSMPALDAAGTEPATLLFVGNFNHVPNLDAALHLATDILPLIRQRRPDALLRLVGERPPAEVAASGVELTGPVGDVLPYLDAATVVVAPLRLGGGTRVKVAEALAAGKAVVAYRSALDGLDVEHGRHVLVARDAGEFAVSVSSLLDDEPRRVALANAARAWAEEHLSWNGPLDRYDELYARLTRGRR